jgi:hypothetical protein
MLKLYGRELSHVAICILSAVRVQTSIRFCCVLKGSHPDEACTCKLCHVVRCQFKNFKFILSYNEDENTSQGPGPCWHKT